MIVIDGVPYPTDISDDFDFSTANEEDLGALLNISPNDIATVEVLKDAQLLLSGEHREQTVFWLLLLKKVR